MLSIGKAKVSLQYLEKFLVSRKFVGRKKFSRFVFGYFKTKKKKVHLSLFFSYFLSTDVYFFSFILSQSPGLSLSHSLSLFITNIKVLFEGEGSSLGCSVREGRLPEGPREGNQKKVREAAKNGIFLLARPQRPTPPLELSGHKKFLDFFFFKKR